MVGQKVTRARGKMPMGHFRWPFNGARRDLGALTFCANGGL